MEALNVSHSGGALDPLFSSVFMRVSFMGNQIVVALFMASSCRITRYPIHRSVGKIWIVFCYQQQFLSNCLWSVNQGFDFEETAGWVPDNTPLDQYSFKRSFSKTAIGSLPWARNSTTLLCFPSELPSPHPLITFSSRRILISEIN